MPLQCSLDAATQEEARLRQELSKVQQRATANRLDAAQALQGLLVTYMESRRAAAFEQLEPGTVADIPAVAGGLDSMEQRPGGSPAYQLLLLPPCP
jgi:hypothetical protein